MLYPLCWEQDYKKNTFAYFVDSQKAFDWIHGDLLEYKLICSGIDGKFDNAIKALYKAPVSCPGGKHGGKQGAVLSTTLFALHAK